MVRDVAQAEGDSPCECTARGAARLSRVCQEEQSRQDALEGKNSLSLKSPQPPQPSASVASDQNMRYSEGNPPSSGAENMQQAVDEGLQRSEEHSTGSASGSEQGGEAIVLVQKERKFPLGQDESTLKIR
jgi:hypothetical protein